MTIRIIFAPVTGDATDDLVMATAAAAAQQFSAHVDVVFQDRDPRSAIPYLGEGVSGEVVAQFVENAEKENASLATRMRDVFDNWRGSAGLTLADAPTETAVASCAWHRSGDACGGGVTDAGLADLTITARIGDGDLFENETAFESALIHGGRPVLLVGSPTKTKLGDQILIAWNGSAESARAVGASLPFLRLAKSITVVTVPESDASETQMAEKLCRYLAWHGVTAHMKPVRDDGTPVGEVLLNEAHRCSADLLVMGAYGHSRFREYILGGATRHILDEGTIPLLMTH